MRNVPPRPYWLNRLPLIISELSSLGSPVIDRTCFERVFRLKRRRAIELMHQLGSYRAGRGYILDRMALLRVLGALRSSPESRWTFQIQEELVRPDSAQSFDLALRTLPDGVCLERNLLSVTFRNPEELLERLSTLIHTLAECRLSRPSALETAMVGGPVVRASKRLG